MRFKKIFPFLNTVTCWVYVTRQITSRRIGYSEFIPLALTITQLLPSAVSQLLLLESLPCTRYNSTRSCWTPIHTGNWLNPHCSLVTGSILISHSLATAAYLGSARTTQKTVT
jgi:hypothetical protein